MSENRMGMWVQVVTLTEPLRNTLAGTGSAVPYKVAAHWVAAVGLTQGI